MRSRTTGLSLMMLATMAVSTLAFFVIAVAASEIQDEFGVSKFELGVLAGVNTVVGALFAPVAGRMSDRFGARNAVGGTLLLSGVSAVLLAIAPSFSLLVAASAVGGFPQGSGNPAANKAIASGVIPSKRGIVTGVKQSGVQVAVALAGLSVPLMSASFGWRSAMWMTAAIAFALLAGLGLVSHDPSEPTSTVDKNKTMGPLDFFVTQVAIFGFLLGVVGGGFGRFLPLFAEEVAGFSIERAGQVFALQGLVAVPARLSAGVALDRGMSARKMLIVMGILGSGAMLIVAATSIERPNLLWIGTVLAGLTIGTWNTAGNVSMIRQGANAGRATGRLMFGFLLGLTVGGPLVGWSIDQFGYTPAWLTSSGVALAGAAVVAQRTKVANKPVDAPTSVR